jgi:Na+/proline symporter
MTKQVNTGMLLAAAIAAGAAGLFWSGDINLTGLVTEARAIIGRPLTPMSYAGVARRTTRRGAYYGAAVGVGAVAAVPHVVAPAPVVVAPAPYVVAPVPYYGRPPCGYYPYPPCY